MIVLDASCLIELLLNRPSRDLIRQKLVDHEQALCAPSLIDVEVCHVLRRFAILGNLSPKRGKEAIDALSDFPLKRFPQTVFVKRIWELRNNLSAYDAAYVALAEALDAVLLTCDKKLAAADGHRAAIEVIVTT